MNFLIGLSLVIPLALFTTVLWILSQRLPGEFVLAIIGIMMFGDALLAFGWYFGIGEEMTNIKQFRLGIAFAFCTTSFGRAIYFMLKSDLKNLKQQ